MRPRKPLAEQHDFDRCRAPRMGLTSYSRPARNVGFPFEGESQRCTISGRRLSGPTALACSPLRDVGSRTTLGAQKKTGFQFEQYRPVRRIKADLENWIGLAVGFHRSWQKISPSWASPAAGGSEIACRRGTRCNQDLREGFRVMLETAVVKSRKMRVFERGRLDAVLAEQQLGQMGLTVRRKCGRSDGRRLSGLRKFGAQKTDFNSAIPGSAGDLDRLWDPAIGKQATIHMAVDLKVTDVSSGRIVVADSVEGSVEHPSDPPRRAPTPMPTSKG